MKKYLSILLAMLFVVSCLTGCGKKAETEPETEAETETEAEAEEESGVMAGGYSIENPVAGNIPENAKTAFDEAIADLDGVSYEPLACIGQQVVAGMNYFILVQAKGTSPEAKAALQVVEVYKAPGATAVFTASYDFNILDYIENGTIAAATAESLSGGINVPLEGDLTALPEKTAAAVSEAFEKYEALTLEPLALVGQQVVAGTNHAMVCRGTAVDGSEATGLFMAVVYDGVDGSKEIISLCPIDLTEIK